MQESKDIIERYNVSRETVERLSIFVTLLKKWQKVTQLVAPGELDHIWVRHIGDSLQLTQLFDSNTKHILDFGSGGGFPGIVLALVGMERNWRVQLVESNARKVAFLRAVSRETGSHAEVIHSRFEDLTIDSITLPQFITARAVADLSVLLHLSEPYLLKGVVGLFPKGRSALQELKEAEKKKKFSYTLIPSHSEPSAHIVRVTMSD